MISFQVEHWADFERDATELWPRHWEELALDKDKFALGIDFEKFRHLESLELLHLVTARNEGKIVGYYLAIVMPHMHYKDAGKMAFTDMYFILPEFRKGSVGIKLFTEAERTLKERGVVKAYLSCKAHKDVSTIFETLGWRLSDISYTKVFV